MHKDKKWLEEKYTKEQLSTNEISILADVSGVTIGNWLRKHDIPIRSGSEQATLRNKKIGRWQGKNNPSKNKHPCYLAGMEKRDISGSKNGMFGQQHSLETRKKIAASRKPYIHEKAPNWKGEDVGYAGLHIWVRKYLGLRPRKCEQCGVKGRKRDKGGGWTIEFANKSGLYKRDLKDWLILCRTCHRVHDKQLLKQKN